MSNTPYVGGMTAWGSVAAWQAAAEEANAVPEVADLTASQDGNAVRLEGQDGQTGGFGNLAGEPVPNLSVTKVTSNQAETSGLPSNLATNPLAAPPVRAAVRRGASRPTD